MSDLRDCHRALPRASDLFFKNGFGLSETKMSNSDDKLTPDSFRKN